MISVKKRQGESMNSLLYRFTTKLKRSGLVKEVRRKRFRSRPDSKLKVLRSALTKDAKKKEHLRKRKLGIK